MQTARFGRSVGGAASIALAVALSTLSLEHAAYAAGAAPATATKEQKEQAQSHFLRGKELFGQNKFDAAFAEFTASFDVVASPNTRLYIARCLREMGKNKEAHAEFGRTVTDARALAREDSRYEKAADAADQERKALEPKVGLVDVSVKNASSSTTLKVGGEEVPRSGWNEPVAVSPGANDVVVETPGKPLVKKSVNVSAGSKESVSLDAGGDGGAVAKAPERQEKPVEVTTPSDRAGLRPYAYVAGGVALAGLATFTIAGLLANGTYSDLEQECGGERACPPGHKDEISKGKSQQTIANVGLVFFVLGAAGAVTLWVLSTPSKASTTSAKVVTRGSFVGLEGTF